MILVTQYKRTCFPINRLTWGSDGLKGSDSSSSGTDPSLSDSLQEANMEPTQGSTYYTHIQVHVSEVDHIPTAIETNHYSRNNEDINDYISLMLC